MIKFRTSVWSAGLFAVAFIVLLVLHGAGPLIEADLRARAEQSLSNSGLAWLSVELSGRDAILEGAVFTPDDKVRAEKALEGVWGLGRVRSQLQLVVRDTPYVLRMQRGKSGLKLRGKVPSEQAHKTVLGLANAIFPGFDISARLQVDPNMTKVETWLSGVGFALRQLTRVSRGNADLADTTLSLQGTAAKVGDYERVLQAVQDEIPEGISIGRLDISPRKVEQFIWQVQLKAGNLVIGGHIPGDVDKVSLVFLAEGLFPETRITDATVIARGAPKGWKGAARLALLTLANMHSGAITITDTDVKIEGVAKDDTAIQRISALAKNWPRGYKLQSSVRVTGVSLREWGKETKAATAQAHGEGRATLD